MAYNGRHFPFNRITQPMGSDLFTRYEEIGNPPAPPGTSFRITEAGDMRITEDGFDRIIE